MAALDGTQKADVYETLSSLNMAFAGIIQHLQNKRQSCSQVLLLNCKPNLTRNFWKTCTSLSLTTGAVTEKRDNAGKNTCATLTTYCFKPKNEKSNLRNNARKLGAKGRN
jgi:hypothetical protein